LVEAYLSARGIVYEERDVSRDQSAVFELVRTYNSRSTPTLVIGEEVIVGFDPRRLDVLLAGVDNAG
jgi:glutaredoxin